jgi:Transcriptional regulators
VTTYDILETEFHTAARLLVRREMMMRRDSDYYGRHFSGSPGQRRILALLKLRSPVSQKELLDICGIRPASLSELLNKMEHAGYVSRSKDETDKRSVLVSLTEAGRKAADEWDADTYGTGYGMFDCLTAEEQSTLSSILKKLISGWAAGDEDRYDREDRRRRAHHGFGRGFADIDGDGDQL